MPIGSGAHAHSQSSRLTGQPLRSGSGMSSKWAISSAVEATPPDDSAHVGLRSDSSVLRTVQGPKGLIVELPSHGSGPTASVRTNDAAEADVGRPRVDHLWLPGC